MLNKLLRPNVRGLTPYDSGPSAGIKLDANENPFPWPEKALAEIAEATAAAPGFNRYPDGAATELRAELGERLDLRREQVLVGNGADELIAVVLQTFGGPAQALLVQPPTFSMYGVLAAVTDTPLIEVPLQAEGQELDPDGIRRACRENLVSVIIVCNPNNPTGALFPRPLLADLLTSCGALVVVDEAYGEFAGPETSMMPYIGKYQNLLVMKTFSKAYGMAGLRLGYICGTAEAIALLNRVRQTYNVNVFTQRAGRAALRHSAAFAEQIAALRAETEKLYLGLRALPGLKVWPTRANFVLFQPRNAVAWGEALRQRGIAVRVFARLPVLGPCLRVSAGRPEETALFLRAAAELSAQGEPFQQTNAD
ncbi:MAG: histidinol-phosphate transaminase [Gracilibacteraceae bacterium]|jgi:histidinol-phosphate aminotransferase|nr:histidinol-phosphate transaminase [Gracilibacteraceae bacterium]